MLSSLLCEKFYVFDLIDAGTHSLFISIYFVINFFDLRPMLRHHLLNATRIVYKLTDDDDDGGNAVKFCVVAGAISPAMANT